MSSNEVYFLFGTESGNSEKIAKVGCAAAKHLGYDAILLDMAQFDVDDLKEWENVFVVIRTSGEGEMPLAAEAAWDDAKAKKLTGLKQLNFAVLGLGDSTYDYYCQSGTDWDNYLESTGARRICDRGELDVDYFGPGVEWFRQALAEFSGKDEDVIDAAIEAALSGAQAETVEDTWTEKNPWQASVVEKRNLCSEQSSKSVRHYALDLTGSDLHYRPGDCIEVKPVNDSQLVEDIIQFMDWTGDEAVTVEGVSTNMREALTNRLEIREPTLKLLKLLSSHGVSPDLKRTVELGSKDDIENFSYGLDVLSAYQEFSRPPAVNKQGLKRKLKAMIGKPEFYPRIAPSLFVGYVKVLQSRAYSIASSQAMFNDQVHLTIADVAYERKGRNHKGVCSNYLADKIKQGDKVNCWLRENKYFKLPENDALPVIMVGPGTGIAPFMGFLQERAVRKASGKNWLFFGDRNQANDFLYREELEKFQADGVLTRLDTAFSRDQAEKLYVQHKMLNAAKDLFQWLEEGAAFYICGDARTMAKDVEQTLFTIIKQEGGLDDEQTRKYIKTMQREQRYLKDVY